MKNNKIKMIFVTHKPLTEILNLGLILFGFGINGYPKNFIRETIGENIANKNIYYRHDQSVFSLLRKLNNIFTLSVNENCDWSLENKGRNWDHLIDCPIQARRDFKYFSFYAFKKKINKFINIK